MNPTKATKASRAFLQSRLDSAGSLPLRGRRWFFVPHRPYTAYDVTRPYSVVEQDPAASGITVPCERAHSVVVRAPYGLTATTASSSLDGRWRDVTVTHSPGFTVSIADNSLSNTLPRIVTY